MTAIGAAWPGVAFSSARASVFDGDSPDDRLSSLVHMNMLDPDQLRAAVPQST